MPVQSAERCIITLNGGSSTIKFAVFSADSPPTRVLGGTLELADGRSSSEQVLDDLLEQVGGRDVIGVGHRVVHGGAELVEHQIVTDALVNRLREVIPLDPAHLPDEIELIESARRRFDVPHIACFDTAFHREMPAVASLLPIPRRYTDAGVRRLGFHGLSFTFLLSELRRSGNPEEADGRVILAHLGSGASLAAAHKGKPVDTTMAFTPTSGLVMATRSGDLDPGLLTYMMRTERSTAEQLDEMLNRECGLIGVSGTSGDMRKLLDARSADPRAAEAVDLFCYHAARWVGALSVSLNGLDTLVFSAGIGENAPPVREMICDRLRHFGVQLDPSANSRNAPVISTPDSRVTVRVIPTDEEVVIAGIVMTLLNK